MTEEDQVQEATAVAQQMDAKRKKKLISLPFLIIAPILGVIAFFVAIVAMYLFMLNGLKNEAAKPAVIGEAGNRGVEQASSMESTEASE